LYPERASRRFIDFFTASIRNRNTRMAYARAVKQFFDRCDERRLELPDIEAITVASYIEQLGTKASKPTVKQHLVAIRQLFDYLTTGGILEVNPAASVRGPWYVVKRGKTPVLSWEEARKLLDTIESNTLIGLSCNRSHHRLLEIIANLHCDRCPHPGRSCRPWSQ
jgi:integrase/recombinase XerD